MNAGFVTPGAFSRIVLSVDDLDFAQVYERHARDIYRFSVYLSGDVHVAEEVTAETFARAWASRERVRLGSVKAYLLMIARNLIRDMHRAPAVSSLPGDTPVADQAADQERTAHARQEWRTVQRALAGLPEVDRAILLIFIATAVVAVVFWIAFFVSLWRMRARILVVPEKRTRTMP